MDEANKQQIYKATIRGYYRFSAHESRKFTMEEFRLRYAKIADIPENLIGRDFIPNDICPTTFNTERMVVIDKYQ